MALRANFNGIPDEDSAIITAEWLNRFRVSRIYSRRDLDNHHPVYVQLHVVPDVLSYFNQLEGEVSISKISDAGISFCITDTSLWLGVDKSKQRVTSERPVGVIFCPMSNVVCINTFGNLIPKA